MSFRIEYFDKGVLIGAVPCSRSIADARELADYGMKLRKAELAKIVDMDQRSIVVEIVRPNA